jgi:hypothetical protein
LITTGFSQLARAYSCATTGLSNDGCVQGNFVYDKPVNIAIDAPFGIADWVALDTSNDGADDGFQGIVLYTADTRIEHVGVWKINSGQTNPWDKFTDMMITMQGGPGNNYVAYSLKLSDLGGYYLISATEPDLVHARLWGTLSAVPLPTSIWLFGTGLLGLVTAIRWKSNT